MLHWYPPKQTISDEKERIMHLLGCSSFVLAILEKWTVELDSGVGSNLKFKELCVIIFGSQTKTQQLCGLYYTLIRGTSKCQAARSTEVLSFHSGFLTHLLLTLLNYPSKCFLLFFINLIRTEELKHL